MIVVEGPDGSGKSTLVKAIEAEFNVTVAPRVVSTDAEAMVDLKAWTEVNVRHQHHGVVFDRHRLISEPIYGPILRSQPEPGFDSLGWLNAMFQLFYANKPTIIYCLPNWAVVRQHQTNLPKGATEAQARKIYDLYLTRAGLDLALHRAVHYDFTEGSLHTKSILNYIRYNEGIS